MVIWVSVYILASALFFCKNRLNGYASVLAEWLALNFYILVAFAAYWVTIRIFS